MKKSAVLSLAALAFASGCASTSTSSGTAALPRTAQSAAVNFAIIGDTGVLPPTGDLDRTSKALADGCAARGGCSFALMTGDNIYPSGASGDPAKDGPVFEALFARPFSDFAARNPQAPIIVALGNHDWYTSRRGAFAEMAFHAATRPFFMDGPFFKRRVSEAQGGIDIFVIDSEMLLSDKRIARYDLADNGEMIATGRMSDGGHENARPQTDAERAMLGWLEQALAGSDARWKFVVAHHPLWQGLGDSKYTQSVALREMLMPMLCRHADAYFAGHQHTIEIHRDSCANEARADGKSYQPLPVIVSGAGAKAREVNTAFLAWQSRQYPQNTVDLAWGDVAGLVFARIEGNDLVVEPVRLDGAPATQPSYRFNDRQGQ